MQQTFEIQTLKVVLPASRCTALYRQAARCVAVDTLCLEMRRPLESTLASAVCHCEEFVRSAYLLLRSLGSTPRRLEITIQRATEAPQAWGQAWSEAWSECVPCALVLKDLVNFCIGMGVLELACDFGEACIADAADTQLVSAIRVAPQLEYLELVTRNLPNVALCGDARQLRHLILISKEPQLCTLPLALPSLRAAQLENFSPTVLQKAPLLAELTMGNCPTPHLSFGDWLLWQSGSKLMTVPEPMTPLTLHLMSCSSFHYAAMGIPSQHVVVHCPAAWLFDWSGSVVAHFTDTLEIDMSCTGAAQLFDHRRLGSMRSLTTLRLVNVSETPDCVYASSALHTCLPYTLKRLEVHLLPASPPSGESLPDTGEELVSLFRDTANALSLRFTHV